MKSISTSVDACFSAGVPFLVEGRPKPDVRMVITCAFLFSKCSNGKRICNLLNNNQYEDNESISYADSCHYVFAD